MPLSPSDIETTRYGCATVQSGQVYVLKHDGSDLQNVPGHVIHWRKKSLLDSNCEFRIAFASCGGVGYKKVLQRGTNV